MKLLPKILSLVLGIMIISVTALALPLYWYSRSALEDELDDRLLGIAQITAENLDKNLVTLLQGEPDLFLVRARLEKELSAFHMNQITGLAVFTLEGVRLAATTDRGPDQTRISMLLNGISVIGDYHQGRVSEWVRYKDRDYYKFAVYPLELTADNPVVIVTWGGTRVMSQFEELMGSIFWLTLITILITVSLTVVFSRSIIGPVRRLSDYSRAIQKNIYTDPVRLNRKDEIGDLNVSLEKMHAEIRENEKRNKQLLSGVAHEIKNPLGGIEIYAGLLKEELSDSKTHKTYLDKITRELHHLKQIVLSYLDFARPPKSNPKDLDIMSIVEDGRRILAPELQQKGAQMQISGTGHIVGDESKLRRVFVNILQNSLEALHSDGTISVVIQNLEGTVSVIIEDNGDGIPEEHLGQIFQPYYSTREKGYGLGLAIVKNIVDEMNGTIFVESTVESGTRITLKFPKER